MRASAVMTAASRPEEHWVRCRQSAATGVLAVLAAVLSLVGLAPPSSAASPSGRPHVARLSSVWLPYWDAAAGLAGVRAAADVYGDLHERGAVAVAAAGVVGGYPDGSFRPGGHVARGQLATVLTRALRLPVPDAPATPTDVAGSAHATGIAAVTAAGLAGGFADGTFRPDQPVTRGQLATVLTRAWALQVTVSAPYSDRDLVHGYGIAAVTEAGWMGGHADGTFRSEAHVTRGQLATVLARALPLPGR